MMLYKYRSLEVVYDKNGNVIYDGLQRCIDIIKNNRLYFPKRKQLNDPYEGIAVPINLGICGAGIFSDLGLLHPILEDKMDEYRILSLSATPLSMQMWAHYASNYNGICFEFYDNGIIGNARKVEYIDKPYDEILDPEDDLLEKTIHNNFYYKSTHWKYEEEYRIVEKCDNEFIGFNKSELRSIILGKEAMKRKDVMEELVDLALKNDIAVYYTLFTPCEYKLTIATVDEIRDIGAISLKDIIYM